MSRGQQGQVFNTSAAENSTYTADAEKSLTDATASVDKTQEDTNNYADAVGKFSAADPYTQGGTVQTAQNQQTADTASGLAEAGGQALQGAAVRTGANPGGAIAAEKDIAAESQRRLTGEEAGDTIQRAGAETGYQDAVLGDTSKIAGLQSGVTGADTSLGSEEGKLASGAMSAEEEAAKTPSFLESVNDTVDKSAENFAQGAGSAVGKAAMACWIAAELYGGWDNWRVARIRTWLFEEFSQTWYGTLVCRAYLQWGERVAVAIRTRKIFRRGVQWLFDKALRAAVRHGR